MRRNSAFVHNHFSSLSWPALAQKTLAVGPEEVPTRHVHAPEVTVETRLALARASTPAFGPTVETRLLMQGLCKDGFAIQEDSSLAVLRERTSVKSIQCHKYMQKNKVLQKKNKVLSKKKCFANKNKDRKIKIKY